MQWKELCEKAKDMGYYYCDYGQYLTNDKFIFYKKGTICSYIYVADDYYSDYHEIAWDRTPDQMHQIMEALQ